MSDEIKLADPVGAFKDYGFAQVKLYNQSQVEVISSFAKAWIYRLLSRWVNGREDIYPLMRYHSWFASLGIDHGSVFCAKNRHTVPEAKIKTAIINENVKNFLSDIGIKKFNIWDEGLGWLAFRFVRPGFGDGYPMSKKEWGVAKNVVSCWIPIIGHTHNETITLVPGSHLKEYEKYKPADSKFTKDEYRLKAAEGQIKSYNPELNTGDAVFYHPRLLHSEDVIASKVTRLNLEFRINPA